MGPGGARAGAGSIIGDLVRARRGGVARGRLQVPCPLSARWVSRRQGRPLRRPHGDPAEDRIRRLGHGLSVAGRRLARGTGHTQLALGADVDLRGASRVVAPRRRRRVARLPGRGLAPGRPCVGPRLHPHRAASRHGTPLLRLVGLPDDGILRPDRTFRDAAGPDVPHRSPAPTRSRCDPRLGSLALPHGRARVGVLRRDAPLRARRPATGLPPRLAHADLQLTRARKANGYRTRRADGRTCLPCRSSDD